MVPATNLPTADNPPRTWLQRTKKALRHRNDVLGLPPENLVEGLTHPHPVRMKIHHLDTIDTLS
jgi:hypothetical protein